MALAGFGRAIAEVGAVLIVGGNINVSRDDHQIALEIPRQSRAGSRSGYRVDGSNHRRQWPSQPACEQPSPEAAMPDSAPFADAWRAGASAVRGSLLPIEASGVVFEAAGRRLIDGVDLRLEDRALTVVMGPNGAGKA